MVVRYGGMRAAKALVLAGIWACGAGTSATQPSVSAAITVPTPITAPGGDPCGGGAPKAPDPCSGTAATHGTPATPAVKVTEEPPIAVPDASAPEWFAPAWTKVAVGQTIAFATTLIDQDLDETRVVAKKLPASAKFDAITQTIVWTPIDADLGKQTFELEVTQPGRNKTLTKTFAITVVKGKALPAPVAPPQTPIIETLLMIRQPERLVDVNIEWPLTKMLEVGAQTFKLQIPEDRRRWLTDPLDGGQAFRQMLYGLSLTHGNPRLDPSSPSFDKQAFGDPTSWKIVTVRPRIDRAWTELRVVYQAMNAHEPVFAMFRLRPVVEYVPALPRPEEEKVANNKLFLGMVAKHLMKDGGVNKAYVKDIAGHSKAVAALMTELMTFDDLKTKPYLHGFMIGIATEARMGGGSARNADGSYKSGDGWGWAAMKPFAGGAIQVYQNVAIPGFWTDAVPSADNKTWVPKCATRFNPNEKFTPGYEKLCRKTLGFVDLPMFKDGTIINSKVDANHLFFNHKKSWMVTTMPLEDGRRDLGEENGMTCSQCHIRNFGMHDYKDLANVDPSKGVPKKVNKKLPTLNFQIIPGATWEAFTLDFLKHQECRGKTHLEQYLGAAAAKGLTCPLAK
jgi:hypothetical protein